MHSVAVCFAQPETYSFIWNGYMQESRNIEKTANKQAMNISKTEYFYDSNNISSMYSKYDFYTKVKKKNILYTNMPNYESVDFLPNSTAIVKDTLLNNELVVTSNRFGLKNEHQPSQSIYYVWKQSKWLPQTKHEYQIDTIANSKTDTEYRWSAENSTWTAKERRISSYPAVKDTAQSVATFKYDGSNFVLKGTKEITYENGRKKEEKRTAYNSDLSIKSQSKTVYYHDDPSGYTASQQFKLNLATNEWETQGEKKIHQSKRSKEREKLAEEQQQKAELWAEKNGYELETGSRALTRTPSAGNKKILREEMVFDPATNKWRQLRIVSDK